MGNDNTLKELEQRLKKRKLYQIKRSRNKRNIDVDNATVGDVADVLATVITDLKEIGIFK